MCSAPLVGFARHRRYTVTGSRYQRRSSPYRECRPLQRRRLRPYPVERAEYKSRVIQPSMSEPFRNNLGGVPADNSSVALVA